MKCKLDVSSIIAQELEVYHIDCSAEVLEACNQFAAELVKWNQKINLTALTSAQDIAVKHFVDSFHLAHRLPTEGRLLDIGSGGGFPAIPIKFIRPELEVVSIDAVGKKIQFQRHAARLLCLERFEALHIRAEELAGLRPKYFDIVVSRAFTNIEAFAAVALPLLSERGKIIAMAGPVSEPAVAGMSSTLAALGCRYDKAESYRLPFGMGSRSLVSINRITF